MAPFQAKKGWLITLLSVAPWNDQDTNYDSMRLIELRALVRERRLWGHSRLRKAGLIALLQDNEPMLMPVPLVHANPRPSKPTRPPPPPPRFLPYELD